MQFFSSASKLISFKPFKFLNASSLQAALFASSDKNKQIIDKFSSDQFKDLKKNIPSNFVQGSQRQNPVLQQRNIYSEKANKLFEIPTTPLKEIEKEAFLDNETSLSTETSKAASKGISRNKEELPTERLSKKMSRLGICSRRQAEKLIQTGIVKVNNKPVDSNVPVTINDKISIFTRHGERIPVKEDSKIWVFNKPKGLICTHNDPQGRKTIFEYLRESGFESEHFMSVGRLDFLSEGLILLTNDGELAQALERPSSQIERMYRVRIFGRFDEEKLQKIRKGAVINGIKYGPYWVEVEKRQTRNTWLRIKLTTGKNREIRKIMQKFSLRVNRLQRVKYGPYSVGKLEHGNWVEVQITSDIKRLLYMRMRHKVEEKQQEEKALLGEREKNPQIEHHREFKSLPFTFKSDANKIESRPRAKMTTRKIEDSLAKKKLIVEKK